MTSGSWPRAGGSEVSRIRVLLYSLITQYRKTQAITYHLFEGNELAISC